MVKYEVAEILLHFNTLKFMHTQTHSLPRTPQEKALIKLQMHFKLNYFTALYIQAASKGVPVSEPSLNKHSLELTVITPHLGQTFGNWVALLEALPRRQLFKNANTQTYAWATI